MILTAPGTVWLEGGENCGTHSWRGNLVFDLINYEREAGGARYLCASKVTNKEEEEGKSARERGLGEAVTHEYAEAAVDPRGRSWIEEEYEEREDTTEIADLCISEPKGHEKVGGIEAEAAWIWDKSKAPNASESYWEKNCALEDFEPKRHLPVILTNPPLTVNATEATLWGRAEPNGLEVTDYHFEWEPGTISPFSKESPKTPAREWRKPEPKYQGESQPAEASEVITGLEGCKIYHDRFVLEERPSISGATYEQAGEEREFRTPPTSIFTEGAEKTAPKVYKLHAYINPGGVSTQYGFEIWDN